MSGLQVNLEALSGYSQHLANDKSSVSKVGGLVSDADVGDESWGVVGLFVKEEYTGMLEDLKELLKNMETGLQSASDKVATAAKQYQDAEDGHQSVLKGLVNGLESTVVKTVEA